MTDPTTKIAVDVGTTTLSQAYKNRAAIIPALKAGLRRLTKGKVTVAIFGPGGVGKSTTQTFLSEGLEKAQKPATYYPTIDASKKKLKGDWTIKIWDTPGQDDFREAGWDDAFKGVEGSTKCLLINIVSFGYNSTGSVPFSEMKAKSPKTKKEEIIRNYLRLERKKEIELVGELHERIKGIQCKVHLLTIINKQDLWWSEKKAVYKHYMSGPYHQAVVKIFNSRKKGSFSHTVKEVSLCPVNLVTIDEEVLAQTCQGYDAVTREVYLNHLLKELTKVVGFED